MDRVFETDGRPLLRQLLGGRAGPLLTGGAFSRLAAREVRLDEEAWHPSTLRRARRNGNVRTSELCSAPPASSSHPAGELGARPNPELGVDVRQMACNRPLAEKERGGDLPVRPALGDEGRNSLLGRCQPAFVCAPSDAPELVMGLSRPRWMRRAARSRGARPGARRGLRPSAGRVFE